MTTTAYSDDDLGAARSREQMSDLIERHLAAAAAGEVDGAIA